PPESGLKKPVTYCSRRSISSGHTALPRKTRCVPRTTSSNAATARWSWRPMAASPNCPSRRKKRSGSVSSEIRAASGPVPRGPGTRAFLVLAEDRRYRDFGRRIEADSEMGGHRGTGPIGVGDDILVPKRQRCHSKIVEHGFPRSLLFIDQPHGALDRDGGIVGL